MITNNALRELTPCEIEQVGGSGAIQAAAEGAGAYLGGTLGTASGGQFGAALGGTVCGPLGPEASATCALIGYFIGRDYGPVIGTAGGAALGELIGSAIEQWLHDQGIIALSDYTYDDPTMGAMAYDAFITSDLQSQDQFSGA
jgi:hypothetical protein